MIPIAKDMVNILPEDVWNKDTTFLDPCCKSGVFLHEIYLKLMETSSMIQEFPDKAERRKHILQNQLYGISPNGMCQLMSTRTVYGTIQGENNIISFENNYLAVMQNADKTFLYERLKKEFNTMRFDVVIGNPPYNKGMDLDFVDLGYKISNKYTVMITPAKWQTASGEHRVSSKINYSEFREKYVKYMDQIVFYPCCKDIFDIYQPDGITYYLLTHTEHDTCTVVNRCKDINFFNGIQNRNIKNRKSLLNIGNEIIDYLGEYETFCFPFLHGNKKYEVWTNTQPSGYDWYATDKPRYLLCPSRIIKRCEGERCLVEASKPVFETDSLLECQSFMAWINTKFTRFFLMPNISRLTGILTDDCFRFVPTPPSGKFNHIYTDEELYKAFNLPQKYIDVIESVIKERK